MTRSHAVATWTVALALSAGFLFAACDAGDPTSPLEAPVALSAAIGKTDVCHRTTDGNFTKISVADAAYDTHIAHGDHAAGTGGLDLECQPATCPCFSEADIDPEEVGGWSDAGWPSIYDLRLVDKSFSDLGYSVKAYVTDGAVAYECGVPIREDLTQAQAEDCRHIILAYEWANPY